MKTCSIVRSEAGFGLVGFLALLPLLVATLSAIAGASLLMKTDAKFKHSCRTDLLTAQQGIAENLKRLIAMNPEAAKLRKSRKAAEAFAKTARATGIPHAVAAAEASLATVRALQLAFRSRQLALIYRSKLQSRAAPGKAGSKLIASLRTEAQLNGSAKSLTRSRFQPAAFEIVESPAGDASPDVQPSDAFTARQTMHVLVESDITPLLPPWLMQLLPRGLKIKTECTATIEKENKTWIEKLSVVK